MVFLWFSYGFPMVFLWFSYGFPMVFQKKNGTPKPVHLAGSPWHISWLPRSRGCPHEHPTEASESPPKRTRQLGAKHDSA